MIFHPGERVALFIDGANLYSAARSLGFDIDYKRLLDLFAGKGRMIRAFYYTALLEDQEYSPIRPLVDWLDYNGYTLVTKPAKEFTDSAGRRKVKGNMDIELAVDMMEIVDRVDHVVLFSGDGDFRSLLEAVQRKGVRASVVSSIRTQPPMIADELRRQADQFIELDQLSAQIERVHSDRGPRRERPSAPHSAPVEADEDLDDEEDFVDDEYEDDEPPAVVRRTPPPRR
ncbi:MAG: NYN domain-containing protein [Thalassobaculaceae bacterium]|nr:NYN domain-containing protein [Thalassobaculaceae bacterium]